MAELNPRIMSTWLLFLTRRLLRRRSIFWGHVHGRGKRNKLIKVLRKSQLALSNGMVTYTERQTKDLIAAGFTSPVWNSNNSCVHEADCIPVNGKQNRIVYVGRLVNTKKVAILIKGFHQAFHDKPNMELHIAGEGPEESKLKTLIEKLGASPQIIMHGRVTAPKKLQQIYKDALAAASPGYVGLSCIQAMAHGIPMLISRDEPHSPEIEACIENVNTIFFDTNNTDSLAKALQKIKKNKSLWKERSPKIASFIRSKYTMENMADTLQKAFKGDAST